MTSLCTSQRRRMYVSNETPNDVSVEHRQDFSVVRLHDILLERCDEVSRGRNNNIPSVRLHYVSNKAQIKHPRTSHCYVTKTSQWDVSLTSHYYVSTISPVSPKWNTQQRRSGTSPPRLRVTLLWRLVNRSLLRFQVTLSLLPSRRFQRLI